MINTSTTSLGKWSILAFLIALSLPGRSQKVYPEWVKSIGGPTPVSITLGELPNNLVTDKEGNVYTTGQFSNTVDFDPDPANTLSLTAQGNSDIYILKLSPEGKLLWAIQLGSPANDWESGDDISLDKNGELLIGGEFCNTVDFDPGAGVSSLTTTGSSNSFILKLDTAGNFIWVKSIEGSSTRSTNRIYGITTDDQGSIYATGSFRQVTDFDPGPGTNFLSPSSTDKFLLKLNSNGDFLWAVQNFTTGIAGNYGNSIVIDKKRNIYVGGSKRLSIQTAAAGHIWKLDSTGNTIWDYTFDGSGEFANDYINDIDISEDGFIYATGVFGDTVDFNTRGTPDIYVSKGGLNTFVLKMDTAGLVLWVRTIESSTGITQRVKVDIKGNIIVTGGFDGSRDFDPGPGVFNLNGQNLGGESDAYVWKLNSEGQFMDAFSFGSSAIDATTGMDIDRFGTVYVAGYFAYPSFGDTGTAGTDFDPGPGILTVPIYGSGDAFIAKFICADTNSSILQKKFCGSFLFNGETYTKAGTYSHHLPNIAGCDSTITLELSLSMEETPAIRINAFTLSTAQPYRTYQWFRDGQLIAGATERSYTATQNGSYVVEVTDENDCPGTSEAYVISNVSVDGQTLTRTDIRVYPNPATNNIYIQKPQGYQVSLWSIDGRQLLTPTAQNTISITTLTTGTYWLKITDEQGNRIKTEPITKIAH